VAKQKFPSPVERHPRGAPDDFQQILGRIHTLADILVEGDEKENTVLGSGLNPADQFLKAEIVQKLDLHVPGEFRHASANLVGDGHAGQTLVADDHQPLLARVKTHGHGDVLQNIEFLQDSGHAVPRGHGLRGHVVHTAKNDRYVWKELGPMLIDEIIGVIIGDDDQIEISAAEFILVIIKKDSSKSFLFVSF